MDLRRHHYERNGLAVLGGLGAFVGIYLPWSVTHYTDGTASANGTDVASILYGSLAGTLLVLAAFLIILAALLMPTYRSLGYLVALLGVAGTAMVLWTLNSFYENEILGNASQGYGLYVSLLGFGISFVGGMMALSKTRYATLSTSRMKDVFVDVRAELLDRMTGHTIQKVTFFRSFPFRDFVDDSEGHVEGVRVTLGPAYHDGSGPRCSGSFDTVYSDEVFARIRDKMVAEGWEEQKGKTELQ